MAFVNEKIPDIDRDMFNSFNFTNPLTRKPLEAWKWTIDREREVFLVGLGGQGNEQYSEIPMFYALTWKKNVITLETFRRGVGNVESGYELWWKINRVIIPESLMPEKDTVLDLIKEAFEAYGTGYNSHGVIRVNFDFIATPVFIRGAK